MSGTATVTHDRVIELRRERAGISNDVLEIRKPYQASGDLIPADKREEIERLLERFDDLGKEIELEERMIDRAAKVDTVPERDYESIVRNIVGDNSAQQAVVEEVERELQAVSWIVRQMQARYGAEMPKTLNFSQRKRLEKAGVYGGAQKDLIERVIQRDLSVGTGSEGGVTVPTIWSDMIVESAEQEYGMLKAGATRFVLERFGKMTFPHDDNEAAEEGSLIGESTDLTIDTAMSFGSREISPYKYTSKIIRASYELLVQSGYDISSFVTMRIGRRIGRIFNRHMTVGTGSSQPGGVVTRAHSAVTAASATAITWPELVQLYAAILSGYGMNASWMFNRKTLGAIMSLRDTDNNPIFLAGLSMRAPDTLMGRPIVLNDHCQDIATGVKAVLFGDFSNYMIIEEATVNARVLVERYADVGDVGFVATKQCGGDLVDSGARPVIAITQA